MAELTPTQVVSWLREQAAKYTDMANEMERTFGIGRGPATARSPVASPAAMVEVKTLAVELPAPEHVKSVLGDRKMRAKDLADQLGVPVENLNPILTEEHGFVRGDRGWISVKKEVAA